jgi:hypothetical protein
MKVVRLKKGGGKTTAMIKEAAANGYTMVCIDSKEVRRVKEEAKVLGLKIENPITFYDFAGGIGLTYWTRRCFAVDNYDMFIQFLVRRLTGDRVAIAAISMTDDECVPCQAKNI